MVNVSTKCQVGENSPQMSITVPRIYIYIYTHSHTHTPEQSAYLVLFYFFALIKKDILEGSI